MATKWTKPTVSVNPKWTQVTAPAYPAPSYQTGSILTEDGFNLLQEDGFKLLYEYVLPLGFQPTINSIVTVWN